MKTLVSEQTHQRIFDFYINAVKKWKHSWCISDSYTQIDKVEKELNKVGISLITTSKRLSKWKGYNVCRSKNTGWYFAYLIQNNVIYIYYAENYRNMGDKTYTSDNFPSRNTVNKSRQQLQFQKVKGHENINGFTLIRSTNGLYNYLNSNGQIFYPNKWFNQAYDFQQGKNGLFFARVESNNEVYLLTADKVLHKAGHANGYTTEATNRLIVKIMNENKNRKLIKNIIKDVLCKFNSIH